MRGEFHMAGYPSWLRKRGISIPGADFTPTMYPGLAYWQDPFDLSVQTHRYGASFPGGDNQNYLSTADHALFDFSGGPFSIAFSHNANVDCLGALDPGAQRTFIGQNRDAQSGGGGWWIVSGSGAGQSNRVYLWLSTQSDGNGPLAYRGTATNALRWSRCVVTFAAGVVKIYLDGIEYGTIDTYDASGTAMPAAPFNPTSQPFTIGREGHSAHRDAIDIIHDVRVYQNKALSQAEVTEDWNAGAVKHYAQLSAGLQANCSAAWDLDNDLLDKTANGRNMAVVGTGVTFEPMVLNTIEKSPFRRSLYPCRQSIDPVKLVSDYTIKGYSHAPRWLRNGINGRPCLRLVKGNNWLYTAASQPWNTNTVDIFEAIYWDELPVGEQFTLLSADEAPSPNQERRYFMTGYTPDGADNNRLKPSLRIKDVDNAAVQDNTVFANFDLVAQTPYIIGWRMLGSGGAASIECRVWGGLATGASLTLRYPGPPYAQNIGPSAVAGRDNITIAALTRITGPSAGSLNARIGEQIVYSPGLSTLARHNMVAAYMRFWYGFQALAA